MKKHILLLFCFVLTLVTVNESRAQAVLEIGGDVGERLSLTMDELKALHVQKYLAQSMKGDTATYDVVRLIDVLALAGVPSGSQVKGEHVQKVVVVTAADGYKAVFSLAELDPKSTDNAALLAIGVYGKSLDKRVGPLRLIVPNDQLHSRWVREVRSIFVVYPQL
ncbi:molybdopterin-dependent oxidoreductase [Parapedobacter sp. 2B3]|uniref:molybdopterin-dependent oxidoreductase n=1 Tax=Parapedobacter sp. 2B3 TaxID=3342381 RepID=UPI0035B671C6